MACEGSRISTKGKGLDGGAAMEISGVLFCSIGGETRVPVTNSFLTNPSIRRLALSGRTIPIINSIIPEMNVITAKYSTVHYRNIFPFLSFFLTETEMFGIIRVNSNGAKLPEKKMEEKLEKQYHRLYSTRCEHCSGFEEKIERKFNDKVSKVFREQRKKELLEIIKTKVDDLNSGPEGCDYERLFNELKYEFTEYVIKYEFNETSNLSVELAIWLEKKRYPDKITPLNNVISRFLAHTKKTFL